MSIIFYCNHYMSFVTEYIYFVTKIFVTEALIFKNITGVNMKKSLIH